MIRASESLRRCTVLITFLLTLGLAASPGIGAEKPAAQEKVSPKLVKPLKAAMEAQQKEQWDEVLAKANEADAMPGKTAYDQYVINEFKGAALLRQRKFAEVAPLYEQNLASGKMPAAEVNARLKTLVQLFSQLQDWKKVTEYGNRWLQAGNQDANIQAIVAQGYYLQEDYRNSVTTIEGAIKAAQSAGKPPDEALLQMQLNSYVKLSNTAAAGKVLEQLVLYYPKPDYWDMLLGGRRTQKASDRVVLNIYRLSREVGVLKEPEEYLEMTELLLEDGLPGEAKSVMEAGYQAKVFDTPDKARADRYSRRLADAKAAAAKDQQALPSIEKEVEKSPTGQGSVALGMAYSSFGQYDKAIPALTQGLQKGGVREPDQAQLMLGIANLKLGKKDEAVKAFEQVAAASDLSDVARLWAIAAKSGTG